MARAELALGVAVVALVAFVTVQAVTRSTSARALTPVSRGSTGSDHLPAERGGDLDAATIGTTSALRAPRVDTALVRQRLRLEGDGTYIGELLATGDSTLARWPDRGEGDPLRVWVQPPPARLESWRSQYASDVDAAFADWLRPGIPLRIRTVRDSASAEIHVLWTRRFPDDMRIGNTLRLTDQHGWIVGGSITAALEQPNGTPLMPELIRLTLVHEVGHVLGLGHTRDSTSAMAERAYRSADLGASDHRTAALLYRLPPGRVP